MTEPARKNVGGTPISNVEYLRSEILMCGGDTTHYRSKTVKSRIFCPLVCGLSHFEDLIRF